MCLTSACFVTCVLLFLGASARCRVRGADAFCFALFCSFFLRCTERRYAVLPFPLHFLPLPCTIAIAWCFLFFRPSALCCPARANPRRSTPLRMCFSLLPRAPRVRVSGPRVYPPPSRSRRAHTSVCMALGTARGTVHSCTRTPSPPRQALWRCARRVECSAIKDTRTHNKTQIPVQCAYARVL